MKCIVCTDKNMDIVQLPEGPRATECPSCDAHWITNFDYWRWHGQLNLELPEKEADCEFEFADPVAAKSCPDCNVFMAKYRVGHGTFFYLDRCGTCGGTWFDGNEWHSLKSRNLHDEIHKIFGQPWQIAVREEQKKRVIEERMKTLLGEEKYSEANAFRSWLSHDKHREEILQYLRMG